MHAQKIVLVSLLIALSACQKESSAPAPAEPSPPPAPAAMTPPPAAPMESMAPAMPMTESAAPAMPMQGGAAMAPAPQAVAANQPAAAAPSPAAAMTGPSGGDANDPLQLAKAKGCLVCHSIDKKIIGPAWKDVAAKYRGNAGAENMLVDKVGKGGSGVWGPVPMPPNSQVSEADRRTLVKFILSLK